MAIGTTLQNILLYKDMTIAELSERTNISYQTISSIIKRDSEKADLKMLFLFCEVLDVPLEAFKPGEEYTPEKDRLYKNEKKVNDFLLKEQSLISSFLKLNDKAKDMARNYIQDLASITKYCDK